MLAGIVVNNAIVLIDLVNQLRADGTPAFDAIVEGGRRRLRPILMTTLTTVLGMLPLTGILGDIPHPPFLDFLLGSGQGAEIRAPLAFTVIGGLLSSTLLTLVVIPVVYLIVIVLLNQRAVMQEVRAEWWRNAILLIGLVTSIVLAVDKAPQYYRTLFG